MSQLKIPSYVDNQKYFEIAQRLRVSKFIDAIREAHVIKIIHDADMDGFCSAAIMNSFIESSIKLTEFVDCDYELERISVKHGVSFQEFDPYGDRPHADVLIVLDQGCLPAKIDQLKTHCNYLLIIDHHPESLDVVDGVQYPSFGEDGVIHRENVAKIAYVGFSTTALTDLFFWKYAIKKDRDSEPRKQLAAIVNHYDTWLFPKCSDYAFNDMVKAFAAAAFHDGVSSIEWDRLLRSDIADTGLEYFKSIRKYGDQILAVKRVQDETIAKSRVLIKPFKNHGKDYTVGFVYHSDNYDTLGAEVLRRYPEIDFVVIVSILPSYPRSHRLYFRSTEYRTDCSPFARELGGGGSAQACGATITMKEFCTFFQFND